LARCTCRVDPTPADLTIATKVGPLRTSTGKMYGEAGPEQLRSAVEQNRFGVLDQQHAGLVDECAGAGIAFMPFFALGGGHTTLVSENLHQVAKRHGATVFQVAIAWGLARSLSIVQIPGTASLAHVEENMAAAHLELDEADMALLGHG
jgi:pyridoxine 4-dehydrogenase